MERTLLSALIAISSLAVPAPVNGDAAVGTVPFIFDDNRVFAQLTVIRPDGSQRKAFAYVDMGSPAPVLNERLYEELRVGEQKPLLLRVVNEATGLISVDAVIDGQTYPLAIDSGSAYTWLRKTTSQHWLLGHPQWRRGIGAVGESNMQTRADGAEATALLLRIPDITLSELHLREIGALGIAPTTPPIPPMPGAPAVHGDFFDWYSQKAPQAVIGWIGGNVLKGFRVMIDYPRHMTYWQRERELDPHDLDQVGLTLETRDGARGYFVAAVASKDGRPTVEGIQAGDKLIRVDGVPLEGMTRGAIFSSLHGKPGAPRLLTIDRDGREFDAHTQVSAF